MRRPSLAGLCLWSCGALLLETGCGHGCDDIGCDVGATIELAQPFNRPAEYRVTVVADGVETVCTKVVQARQADRCSGDQVSLISGQIVTRTENSETTTSALNLAGIHVHGEVDSIMITIESDGETLLAQSVAPKYRDEEYRGPDCGTCRQATAQLEGD